MKSPKTFLPEKFLHLQQEQAENLGSNCSSMWKVHQPFYSVQFWREINYNSAFVKIDFSYGSRLLTALWDVSSRANPDHIRIKSFGKTSCALGHIIGNRIPRKSLRHLTCRYCRDGFTDWVSEKQEFNPLSKLPPTLVTSKMKSKGCSSVEHFPMCEALVWFTALQETNKNSKKATVVV